MIRLLTKQDQAAVLQYLYQEPAYNIFPIGDIETFGFDEVFQRVYAEIDDFGNYLSVFLRYRIHAIYYSHETRFNEAYLDIFRQDPFENISCKTALMDLIHPHLKDFTRKQMYFCKASKLINQTTYDSSSIVKLQTHDQASKLFDLLHTIEEFSTTFTSRDSFIEGKMRSMEMGETYFIEKDQLVIATLATTAETKKAAMVVAVATDKAYRNQGYASILIQHILKRYLENKKKVLCLFYDNPSAGKLYHHYGFETIGTWDLGSKKKSI